MKFLLTFCALLLLGTTSCVTRIGDFTVASSKNMDIKKSSHVVDTRYRVKGKDSKYVIIFFPTGTPNFKEAMDNAIETAPSCVGLADVTIKQWSWYIPYIFGSFGYEVEGNPIFESQDGIPEKPSYVPQTTAKQQGKKNYRK